MNSTTLILIFTAVGALIPALFAFRQLLKKPPDPSVTEEVQTGPEQVYDHIHEVPARQSRVSVQLVISILASLLVVGSTLLATKIIQAKRPSAPCQVIASVVEPTFGSSVANSFEIRGNASSLCNESLWIAVRFGPPSGPLYILNSANVSSTGSWTAIVNLPSLHEEIANIYLIVADQKGANRLEILERTNQPVTPPINGARILNSITVLIRG
jgi:hypothetical protein